MLFRDNMADIRKSLASKAIEFDIPLRGLQPPLEGMDNRLHSIWYDCLKVSKLFKPPLSHHLNVWTFQEIELSICYRILSFRPLNSDSVICTTSAACYIGIVQFMCTMFLQYDPRRMINFPLVSAQAKSLLVDHVDDMDPDLAFWLAVMSSIWVSSDPDGSWIGPVVQRTAGSLGVSTYDQALRHVEKFPWVSLIHETPARTIWSSVWQDIAQGNGQSQQLHEQRLSSKI